MYFIEDETFARQLQNELQAYDNFKRQKEEVEKENSNPVDSILEYIDPTPSIHDLFMRFNKKFFWNALGMVEVVWSSRMTTCAGLCSFEGGIGLCKISLSAPLLSLRPRKDLVETLLHEMIHAFLFVTHNFKDRDDHGLEFHKHMHRINKEAGTNITVYHSFFNEVEYYQRHIWRCDGPCQKKKPYFGFVRRATNRAPGPNDTWWSEHQKECGGTYIKISEPEKKPKKKKKIKAVETKAKNKDIRDYFNQNGSPQINIRNKNKSNIKTLADLKNTPTTGMKTNSGTGTVVLTNTKKSSITKNQTKDVTKSGSSTSGKISKEMKTSETVITLSTEDSSGSVRETVRKKWANKFTNPKSPHPKKIKLEQSGDCEEKVDCKSSVSECSSNKKDSGTDMREEASTTEKEYKCPVCSVGVVQSEMELHLECCLKCEFKESDENKEEITCESVPCPCCYRWYQVSQMNSHIDECLTLIALKEEALAS